MASLTKEQRQVQRQALRAHADAVKKVEDAKATSLECKAALSEALASVKRADLERLEARAACERSGVKPPRGKGKGEAAEEVEQIG